MSDFFQELTAAPYPTVLALGAFCGLILGYFMAQESLKRKAIHAGLPAQIFHYLAASAICSVIPTVIIAIIAGLHVFFQIISLGVIFMSSTWLLLFAYGLFESQVEVLETKPVRELD